MLTFWDGKTNYIAFAALVILTVGMAYTADVTASDLLNHVIALAMQVVR